MPTTPSPAQIEARLARRLAITFRKSEHAERIEVALFDAAAKVRPPTRGNQWEEADPLTTLDLRRFNALRGQQTRIGRESKNCLAELRALRRDALTRTSEPGDCAPEKRNYTNDLCSSTFEPGDGARNEPKDPAAVNDGAAFPAGPMPRDRPGNPLPAKDDAAPAAGSMSRNEPDAGEADRRNFTNDPSPCTFEPDGCEARRRNFTNELPPCASEPERGEPHEEKIHDRTVRAHVRTRAGGRQRRNLHVRTRAAALRRGERCRPRPPWPRDRSSGHCGDGAGR